MTLWLNTTINSSALSGVLHLIQHLLTFNKLFHIVSTGSQVVLCTPCINSINKLRDFEIHQGAAELFAFECITRWRCSRWAKKTYCSKIHSSTARNEMKTGIVPFSRVRNSKMQSNLTKKNCKWMKIALKIFKRGRFQICAPQRGNGIFKN